MEPHAHPEINRSRSKMQHHRPAFRCRRNESNERPEAAFMYHTSQVAGKYRLQAPTYINFNGRRSCPSLFLAIERLFTYVITTKFIVHTAMSRVFLYGPEVGLLHPPRLHARLLLVEVAVRHRRLARDGRVAAEPRVRAAREAGGRGQEGGEVRSPRARLHPKGKNIQ